MSTASTLSEPPVNSAAQLEREHPQASQSTGAELETSKTHKLPYQASHQVELLHLQAEIEALLQHLRTLKQQRIPTESLEENPAEMAVLASR